MCAANKRALGKRALGKSSRGMHAIVPPPGTIGKHREDQTSAIERQTRPTMRSEGESRGISSMSSTG